MGVSGIALQLAIGRKSEAADNGFDKEVRVFRDVGHSRGIQLS